MEDRRQRNLRGKLTVSKHANVPDAAFLRHR